jgi:predicted RecB family nuclease
MRRFAKLSLPKWGVIARASTETADEGPGMTDRFITPSKITAWLDCEHYLTLRHQVDEGLRSAPAVAFGSFARLLADKGLTHENACLSDFEARGLRARRIPERLRGESFAAWVARVGDPFSDDDWDVLYQMPLVDSGIRGIADFVLRVAAPDGTISFEPVDAKLARLEAKPGHVLQLCFYADAIEACTGRRPERMHLWLGSGTLETLAVTDFDSYWRRMRRQLAALLDSDFAGGATEPQPCEHCAFCEFSADCEARWRAEDSLVFVAGLRTADRAALEAAGVATLGALAARDLAVAGIPALRQERIVGQARLQHQARETGAEHPPFELVAPNEDPVWGHGFAQLPMPDVGDVFLDFEGHPFWRPNTGLFFLFGLIAADGDGAWQYHSWWAHDRSQEGRIVSELIEYLTARREQFPAMHVYHYNHTERSSLERLAADHGVGEIALADLVDTGAFVDLLQVARNSLQAGVESYGLKSLERLTDYKRGHDIDAGAGAVVEYEQWMATGDRGALQRIAAYNEDDVRATRAVRDWLVAQRPDDSPWREAVLDVADEEPELDEQVARLHTYGPDTAEHLLGDVLGYWRREWRAHLAPLLARCAGEDSDALEDPEMLAELTPVGLQERYTKNGKSAKPAMRFTFPPQESDQLDVGDQIVFIGVDGFPGYSSIVRLDRDAGEVDLLWSSEQEAVPRAVVYNGWVAPRPKPAALSQLAAQLLDPAAHGSPSPAALSLLRRDLPLFLAGHGPASGRFSDALDEMLLWTTGLDQTCVAVQGPPGTGKTYRGALQIKALLDAGKRVGITAFSHHAIDNLLEEIVRLFRDDPDSLGAVRKVSAKPVVGLPGVRYETANPAAAKADFRLVAGTTWLFAGNDMAAAPVDVLVIDEAGQLSLADALAACRSARNVLLLGDPLQLPQVSQAAHPHGSGRSALEHVLGDAATMPPERGVFLTQTYRMHPDVCGFISDNVYEGRLVSHASCSVQTTAFGTGLRRIRAEHNGCATESAEEADLVAAEITRLLGTTWVNQHGNAAPLRSSDFLVVAPYNDQVDLLRARLDADPRTAAVPVGTVDKFQGRQAAVVFFSMATSSASDMSRSADFLFSRNRFNVAISRARCLAYLVCTDALLDSRGRDLEEMRLISTLCAFDERCEPSSELPAPRSPGDEASAAAVAKRSQDVEHIA